MSLSARVSASDPSFFSLSDKANVSSNNDFGPTGDFLLMMNLTGNSTFKELTETERTTMLVVFTVCAIVGLIGNAAILGYIIRKQFYIHFVSNYFIAHLMMVNIIACCYLVPMFLWNFAQNNHPIDVVHQGSWTCRLHAFMTCVIWTVVYYMVSCIAGVHYLTFARIHYEHVFGLAPWIICLLTWVIGFCLALPLLTNASITAYDPHYYHCIETQQGAAFKFIAYKGLLGVLTPLWLTFYAYIRILAMLYKYRVVFDTRTIDLFRARHVIYGLLLLSVTQLPLLILHTIETILKNEHFTATTYLANPLVAFFAYSCSLFTWLFYGMSLFFMKEDDIALTHRRPTATNHSPSSARAHLLTFAV